MAAVLMEDLHGQKHVGIPDMVLPDTSGGVAVLIN
jgi:hypothetical protein